MDHSTTPWLLSLKPPADAAEPLPAPGDTVSLPADTLGLALSGGGMGGAAFCLGLLQSLARTRWLRHVDFLSTTAAGGGVGAFLGRFFDLSRGSTPDAIPDQARGAAQNRAAQELGDANSGGVDWLRRHANFLTPPRPLRAIGNLAMVSGVYLVLGWFFLVFFCVCNAISYSTPPTAVQAFVQGLNSIAAPLSSLLPSAMSGPWLCLAEFALWLALVPLLIACWTISEDAPDAFNSPALIAVAILVGVFLVATQNPLSTLVFAAAVFWTMAAWLARPGSEGGFSPTDPIGSTRSFNQLTLWLMFWLSVTAALAAIGMVDALGRWLARWMLEGGLTTQTVVVGFGSLGGIVGGLAAVLRMAEPFLSSQSWIGRLLRPLAPLMFLACGVLPLLVALSCASHVAFAAGNAYWQGFGITLVAVVVSLLLSQGRVPFTHRSSPLARYGNRLACVFLGAVNPQRRLYPQGQDVTRAVAGDDVSFLEYHPEVAGGPLHLINCALKETIDSASASYVRSRPAENMAVGPAGINLARVWHARWTDRSAGASAVRAIAPDGGPHPLLGPKSDPVPVEALDLSLWLSISGATDESDVDAADGSAAPGFHGLAMLRSGFWWNSGLDADERRGVPMKRGLWPALRRCLARWLRGQSLLLSELTCRFAGPWRRHWYLTDGRNFDPTGAYELLRRRVPFVIIGDGGAEGPAGSALARLLQLARVDFGAEVQAVDLRQAGVPDRAAAQLGTFEDVCGSGSAKKHAILLLLRYPGPAKATSQDPWLARRHTWLLYIKATLTGDEPADVQNYAATHPNFPNETTEDRPCDERMWESYRKLGEHIGELSVVSCQLPATDN